MVTKKAFTFPRANFIGFDSVWDEIERLSRPSVDNNVFPRHNIVKHSDTEYSIELALAGYRDEDIQIEVKDGLLIIRGSVAEDSREYVHKGISTKKFLRTFRLSEHVVVHEAIFENGLLVVTMNVVLPEEKLSRIIPIGSKKELLLED